MLRVIRNVLTVLIIIALALTIFANSMTKLIGRDEHMYCTAGVLLAQGKMIYRDFSYIAQMPYHPLLCAVLFKALNTNHYLLVGRGLSVICDILTMVCVVGLYRRIFKSFPVSGTLLGLAGVVLYLFNPFVDYASGFAWNHDVVILAVVLSFLLFVSTDFKQKSKYWRIAGIGALLTLASCMRITTVLVQLLFLAFLFYQSGGSLKQRFKRVKPFLAATALVLIWPVWTIISAPRAFVLNLFWFPMLNGEWLRKIGLAYNKWALTYNSLTTPGYLLLIILTIYLYSVVVWHSQKINILKEKNALLAALLPVVFFVIAFIPITMWKQYLAMPVPFLVIGLAYPLLYLRKSADSINFNIHFKIVCVVISACVVVSVVSNPAVASRTSEVLEPQEWIPIRLHRISRDIAENIETRNSKLILTLAPLYALEGGCDIYTEFSAGLFVYRIADFLSPDNREITHTTGPKGLEALVKKSPPVAVIFSPEPEFFEEALYHSAVKPDWEKRIYPNGPIVYLRP